MVAGVKVASQTPAIRSGQRIIFLTLDDATGPVDVTVFESVQPKVAKTVFHSFVLAVVGTVRRTGYKGVSVVAEDVWDLTALLHARRQGRLAEALAHEGLDAGATGHQTFPGRCGVATQRSGCADTGDDHGAIGRAHWKIFSTCRGA